jgi:SAM-dependent methyltransferase
VLNFFGYYRDLRKIFDRHKINAPAAALEIGSGNKPYVGLRFLLDGSELYCATDVAEIDDFDPELLQGVDFMADIGLIPGDKLRNLPMQGGKLRGFEKLSNTPFEKFAYTQKFNFIFSVSALEHVFSPEEVVHNISNWLEPGGYSWHSIDLRDHRNFDAPLEFLKLSETEYAAIRTENRWRASDWLSIFEKHGLELIEKQFLTFRSATDRTIIHASDWPRDTWVSEDMRILFDKAFRYKSLPDLSTLALRVLHRKPSVCS